MTVVDVNIFVASDKSFQEFAQSIADILELELEVREGKVSPYMLSFHTGQGIYVECYIKESGRVYDSVDENWGLFDYNLRIQVLWTDRIVGETTTIQVPLQINSDC